MNKSIEIESLPDVGTIVQQMADRGAMQSAALSAARAADAVKYANLKKTAHYGYWKARLDDGQILEANDALCEITGYSRAELLAMHIGDLETATECISENGRQRYATGYRGKHGDLLDLHKYAAFSDFNNGFFCGFVNDIALQRKWEQYNQAVLEAIPSDVAVLDHAGVMLAANQRWHKQAMDTADLMLVVQPGMNFLAVCNKLFHSGSHPAGEIYQGLHALLEGSLEQFSHDYACHSSGGLRWFSMQASLIADHNNKVMLTHSEITARRENEEMRNRLSIAVEHSPAAIVIVDNKTRIQYINPRFTEMTGYTLDEVLGENPRVLQSGQTPRAVHRDLWETIGNGKAWQGELINQRKSGELFWDELHISPVVNADGQVTNFVGVHVDITERKKAEDRLNRSRSQLNAFVHHAPVCIAMLDCDLNYVAYSDYWFMAYGHGYDDLTGRQHFDVLADMPDDWRAMHQQCLAGATIKKDEYLWQRADHSQRWLRWVIQPWSEADGQIGGIMVTIEDITLRKLAQSDLHAVLEESVDAIWITDSSGRFVFANPAASRLTGREIEALKATRFMDTVCEAVSGEFLEHLTQLKSKQFVRREWLLRRGDDTLISVELTIGRLSDGRYLAFGRDLTESKRSDSELRKLFQAVEQNPESIIITNLQSEIEYVNQALLDKTGYTREEIIGVNPRKLGSGKTPPENYAAMRHALLKGDIWQGEFYNRGKDGSEYIDLATISPIRQADGKISHYVAIQENITARKKGEARIHELAYFDQLTGLPNRILVEDRLNQVMAISARKHEYGALLFIDLDRFKNVNDTLGHHMGDQMLRFVADGLLGCVRACDTVARFGGDEFIVLLPEISPDEQTAANGAAVTAHKILHALDRIYQLGDTTMHSSASIGVTLFQGETANADQLLKQADLAMYHSKSDGRNLVRFFDPSLEVEMKQRAVMEDDMRVAVERQQFILHYQPQYNQHGELTGAEVLVRWRHPECGLISPAVFIPFAEENGFILPIGEWVLETACRKLKEWESRTDLPQISLAVNVSAVQFKQRDFVDVVQRVLERTGADPCRLKLELTESMLVENVEEIIDKMLILKQRGISFSLDDFGTGYSSLSFLRRLPLDQLKIDQSFVKHVLSDVNDAVIAKTIVTLAHSLGLGVIAEGVETDVQREFLLDAGCGEYQGYLFSRPVPEQDFEQLMQCEVRSRPVTMPAALS